MLQIKPKLRADSKINNPITFKGLSFSPKNKKIGKKIVKFINKHDNFIIVGHKFPDGDCVGGGLALSRMLKDIGKKAEFVILEPLRDKFKFIDPNNEIITINSGNNAPASIRKIKNWFKNLGALITVDTARPGLLDNDIYEGIYKSAKNQGKPIGVLDHHFQEEANFGDLNLSDTNKKSVTQLIMEFINPLKVKLTKKITDPLALGIITDSDRFKSVQPGMLGDADILSFTSDIETLERKAFAIPFKQFKAEISQFPLMSKILKDVQITPDGKIPYFEADFAKKEVTEELYYKCFDKLSDIQGEFFFTIRKNSSMLDEEISASVRSHSSDIQNLFAEKIKDIEGLTGGGRSKAIKLHADPKKLSSEQLKEIIIETLGEIKEKIV